jgi:hypothetical protein
MALGTAVCSTTYYRAVGSMQCQNASQHRAEERRDRLALRLYSCTGLQAVYRYYINPY